MEPGGYTDAQQASTPVLPSAFQPPDAPATTQPLPPPPPSPPEFAENGRFSQGLVPPPKRAGQLSPMWRLAFGLGWAAVITGNAAVWDSSRVIGLSTWWLGPDAEPHLVLIQLLPFYGPILVTIAAISNWRYVPYFGIAVALAGVGIGLGDLGRVRWIATVELVLAGAALCLSTASLAGMYRSARRADPVS